MFRFRSFNQNIRFFSSKFNAATTSNGIQFGVEDFPSKTASVTVVLQGGNLSEASFVPELVASAGASFVLKSLAWNGTENRNQSLLREQIGQLGGNFNVSLHRDRIVYSANVLRENVPAAIEILADVITNTRVTDDDIKSIREEDQSLQDVTLDHLHSVAYQTSALGRPLNPLSQHTISATQVLEHRKTLLRSGNLSVGVAGFDYAKSLDALEKNFGVVPQGNAVFNVDSKTEWDFVGSSVVFRDDYLKKLHLAFAAKAPSRNHPDYLPAALITAVIGSWNSSSPALNNLGSRMAEFFGSNPLVDSFSSFYNTYHHTGMLGLYIVTDKYGAYDALSQGLSEGVRIVHELGEVEFDHAKQKFLNEYLARFNSPAAISSDIANQLSETKTWASPLEIVKKVNDISSNLVSDAAQEYLEDADFALAAVGPTVNVPDYYMLRRWNSWSRI